jgi:signal transduction histidine kinase
MNKIKVSQHSLTKRLLVFLLVPVVLLICIAAAIAIVVASRSINTLYDQQLHNNAETLLALLHYEYSEYSEEEDDEDDENRDSEQLGDELVEIVTNIESNQALSVSYRISIKGNILFTSSRVRRFPTCSLGFSNFSNDDAQSNIKTPWRCYRRQQNTSDTNVPISVEFFEPAIQRTKAIKSLLLKTFSPVFLLPFVVLLIAWWGILRGLKSLTIVSNEVRKRSVNNLDRIPRSHQPREFLPIVDSVNDLLAGVELGVQREKQFTDDAAHELRTPITSIKMIEQLMRRDSNNSSIAHQLDNLKVSAEHCSTLIDQLLRLARLQSTQALDKKALNLHDVIGQQLGLLSPLLTSKQLAVDFDENLRNKIVLAHESLMTLLISNLITNAIKFSHEKGTIYIFSLSTTLVIEDDGKGITLADRSRVFDRFFRAANVRNTEGSGLGLALAKGVADAHGFSLRTRDPIKGKGASFELEFTE